MEKREKWSEILYLTAFVLWLFIGLIKYTYFKDIFPVSKIDNYVFYVVLLLLLAKLTVDFIFDFKHVAGLFLLLLFMTIAWAGGRLQFAVMFALIYSASGVSFEKILKASFVLQLLVFLSTIAACRTGVLADTVWTDGNRLRHGLGFTHCMLASHFGLYLSLIYIVLVKKMTLVRAIVIIGLNYILYRYTMGRTDMYLSVLFVILAFCFGNLGQRIRGERIFGWLAALIPWISLGVSVVLTRIYVWNDPIWHRLNSVLNNRLTFAQLGAQNYGFTWFGQKIRWVGVSSLTYHPEWTYNYVDNSYLMMMFTYGTLFILCYCAAMSYVLYHKMKKKETMLMVCLVVTLIFGLINPQSMYLTYNPFLVLLAAAWNPGKKPAGIFNTSGDGNG